LRNGNSVSVAVTANVKSPRTLSVDWERFQYADQTLKKYKLAGRVDWTRKE
jgi:hypothetical protein